MQSPPAISAAASEAVSVRENLADRAYREIEEKLVTLVLQPGAILSETALSNMLDIGRTPVREALHRLEREGLVIVLPRLGIMVAKLDVSAQMRLLEVRREIERLMARKASDRAIPEERTVFRRISKDMLAAAERGDDIGFMRLDHEFNNLLVTTARNEFLTECISLIAGLSRRFWFMYNLRQPNIRITAKRHAAVAQAIADGDSDGAAENSDKLLAHIESITREALNW